MENGNLIYTLGNYSRPSNKGNRNTIELLDGNTSNWLEHLPAGSISTWEDLGTRFFAQFFPSGRTSKLQNDILMFQQHQEDKPSKARIVEPNPIEDNDQNAIVEVEEKVGEELSDSEAVMEEAKSREIEQDNLGNMSHVMDFTILENLEANIDPSLSQVVFGRPFVELTKLILDRKKGLITFTDVIKEVTFKTSYKDSELNDLTKKGHDLLSFRVILSEDDFRRGY
ncbi:protein kinase-like domain, concanavalin A-like lectin/glucanase domain protein [Tanacetum coccineum]